MIKLCMNCDTENPADAVTCSECGMSLTRAPTGETAEEVRSMASVQDTIGPQARPTPKWALVALGILWSVFVGTAGFVCLPVMLYFSYGYEEGNFQEYEAMTNAIICGATALALAPWVILGVRWSMSARLEDSKAESGTLSCFECGHHNPVGQTQCEECGAWVPQTAKARRALQGGKDEP